MNAVPLPSAVRLSEQADAALARRLRVVHLRQQGMSFRDIAGQVCMSPESVSAIWRRFAVGGVDALADKRLTARQAVAGATDRDARIRSLCERGWTTAAISVELQLAESTIKKVLRRHGVARPDGGLARRLEVIRLRQEQGLSVAEIANVVGLHATSVRGIWRRFDEGGADGLRHKAFRSSGARD